MRVTRLPLSFRCFPRPKKLSCSPAPLRTPRRHALRASNRLLHRVCVDNCTLSMEGQTRFLIAERGVLVERDCWPSSQLKQESAVAITEAPLRTTIERCSRRSRPSRGRRTAVRTWDISTLPTNQFRRRSLGAYRFRFTALWTGRMPLRRASWWHWVPCARLPAALAKTRRCGRYWPSRWADASTP